MSKFRVEIDVSFETEKEAKALLNLVEKFKVKNYKDEVTLDRTQMIVRYARYHECFHDETPAKPCGAYVSVDFDGPEVVHTYKVEDGVDGDGNPKFKEQAALESDLIKDLKKV